MAPVPEIAAVVLAGGSGTRLGADANKVYLDVGGRPVLAWSLATLDAHPRIDRLVVVVREGDQEVLAELLARLAPRTPTTVTVGGATRVASEHAGLEVLRADILTGTIGWVLIHDGARPFVSATLIDRVAAATVDHGAALPGLSFDQPLYRRGPSGTAVEVDHRDLRRVQTPQGFAAAPLLAAYDRAVDEQVDGADTAEIVARFAGLSALAVEGEVDNLKVTVPADLSVAEVIAARIDRPPS